MKKTCRIIAGVLVICLLVTWIGNSHGIYMAAEREADSEYEYVCTIEFYERPEFCEQLEIVSISAQVFIYAGTLQMNLFADVQNVSDKTIKYFEANIELYDRDGNVIVYPLTLFGIDLQPGEIIDCTAGNCLDDNYMDIYSYRIKDVQLEIKTEEEEEQEQVKVSANYSCSPQHNSNRVKIDQSIEIAFEEAVDIKNLQSICARKKGSNENISILAKQTDDRTLVIQPEEIWMPNTEYEIIIPQSTYLVEEVNQYNTEEIIYNFKTNLLTGDSSTYALPNDYVSKNYKYFWPIENKELPPFPSDKTSEYVKEFRNWATEYGCEDVVKNLSDEEVEQILNMEFSAVIQSGNNELFLETNTNKTVKDVMRDLLMIQYMKEYLIKEELRVFENATTEELEDSVKKLNDYYQRLLEYYGEYKATRYDFLSVYYTLLDYSSLFSYYDASIGEAVSKYTGVLLNLEKVRLQIDENTKDLINGAYSTSNTSEQALSKAKELKTYIEQGLNITGQILGPRTYTIVEQYTDSDGVLHTVWSPDINWSDVKAIGKAIIKLPVVDNYIKDVFYTKASGIIGVDQNSIEWYASTKIIDTAKTVLGIATKENAGFILPLEMLKAYMDVAISYYSYIENQYPVWLFYNNYYMKLAAPEAYENIWGNNSSDYKLELGQGMFTSEEYEKEEDAIVKILKSATCETNGALATAYNVYTYQNNYISTHNVSSIIDAAEYLGFVRTIDQYSAGYIFVRYALERYMAEREEVLICNVACPTDVEVIDEKTGDIVYTLSNGMTLENNIYPFGTIYLLGDNLDVKHLRLHEGYSINIVPTADGVMECSFEKRCGNEMVSQIIYTEVDLLEGESYSYNESSQILKKIDDEGEEAITPTEIIEVVYNVDIPQDKVEQENTENTDDELKDDTMAQENGSENQKDDSENQEDGTMNQEDGTMNQGDGTMNQEDGSMDQEDGSIYQDDNNLNQENTSPDYNDEGNSAESKPTEESKELNNSQDRTYQRSEVEQEKQEGLEDEIRDKAQGEDASETIDELPTEINGTDEVEQETDKVGGDAIWIILVVFVLMIGAIVKNFIKKKE